MIRRLALSALILLLVLGHAAEAAADAATDNKQALVLVRVLAYDRNVTKRAGRQVVIGVVRDDSDPVSRRAASAMAYALRAVSKELTVAGRPIAVVELAAGELLGDRLRDLEVTAIYLAIGLEGELDQITAAARARPCLTFSDRPAYLRHGLAVVLGTDVQKKRITIQIDLTAATAQGAKLAAELLRVAEIVKR
ncbi:MAG TPA: YfiR family protein [Kofleriaceae bacterium]|nr:YfiR family protein [Kofleriaceae bacterium]